MFQYTMHDYDTIIIIVIDILYFKGNCYCSSAVVGQRRSPTAW